MIEGLRAGIPARLKMMRPILTLGTIVMLLTSYPLWIGNNEFPRAISEQFHPLQSNVELALFIASMLFLAASLIIKYTRLLLGAGLVLLLILCINDYNRIQPWLLCTGSLLIPFLLYNGRVDDANRYTAYFISLQLILASLYFVNGFYLLMTNGVSTYEVLAPIESIASERQMAFILRLSSTLPYILMLNAILLLIPSIRYLSVTFSIVLNLSLGVFIFAGQLHNPSLAVFNLFLIPLLLLAFSGQTRERYFSPAYLLRFPLFYVVLIGFLIFPVIRVINGQIAFSPVLNKGTHEVVTLPVEMHPTLSNYQKAFCKIDEYQCALDLTSWFRHEKTGEPQVLDLPSTSLQENSTASGTIKNNLRLPEVSISE